MGGAEEANRERLNARAADGGPIWDAGLWACLGSGEGFGEVVAIATCGLGDLRLVPCTVRMGAGALDVDRYYGMHAICGTQYGHGGECVTHRRKCSFTFIARRSDKGVCRLSPYAFSGDKAGAVDAAAALELVSRV